MIDGPLWVRSGPGKSFQQIGSLVVGTPLQVRATHPHWALVTAPGKVTGWVARQYLGQTVRVLARRAGWDQVMLRHGAIGWADAAGLVDQAAYGDRDAGRNQ